MKQIRTIAFTGFIVALGLGKVYSQCTVSKNSQGEIITTCGKRICKGSEYLNFPVWQTGTINIDGRGQSLYGQLAFNVLEDKVLFRLTTDTTQIITSHPVEFTINNERFTILPFTILGMTQYLYCAGLYEGKTKLFRHTTCNFRTTGVDNGYTAAGSDGSWGYYETRQEYFIQKNNGPLKQILLTRKSLLHGLKGKAAKSDARFSKGLLTIDQAIELLTYYDNLPTQ